MYKLWGMLMVSLALTSCASLSKNECLNADWHIIGFEDGNEGLELSRIGQHRKACARVNVVPDMATYEQGHQQGARQYCTQARGYREGVEGAAYYGICPLDLADSFLRGYRDGQDVYALDGNLDDILAMMVDLNNRIVEIEADIAYHESEIISRQSGSASRAEHLAAIRELQRESTELKINVVNANEEKYLIEADYQSLLNRHRSLGY